MSIRLSLFTKPWKDVPLPQLARFVSNLGFDGVELPIRPGFQIHPDNFRTALPQAVREFAGNGLSVFSVAGPAEESMFTACAECGIPMIRVMYRVNGRAYREAEKEAIDDLNRLRPLAEKYGVAVGVQNHCGSFVPQNASGLRQLLQSFDPRHICAIWDAAHNALHGENEEFALNIVWPHIGMVNLKNACWKRTNGLEEKAAEWEHFMTTGRRGLASWPRIVGYLNKQRYDGVVCLTAEYTDNAQTEQYIAEDIQYVRSCVRGGD